MADRFTEALTEIPFAEMLTSMGSGIAEAQFELDKMSTLIALMMSGEYVLTTDEAGQRNVVQGDSRVAIDGQQYSLLQLGFAPTFYQFVDTVLEIKVSIRMQEEHTATETKTDTKTSQSSWTEGGFLGIGGTRRTKAHTTTVSSQFSSKFQFTSEGSSLVRTKLVPVPPPPGLTSFVQAASAAPREVPAK